ncbi:hypothetical protein [Micromonospora globbae]|uniref:hypothetical protein n=1 Tax=Micromonospora globbae TaxID=1894969 RepID=UPI003447B461
MSTTSIKDRIARAKQKGTATKPIKLWLAPDMGLVEQYQQALVDLERAEAETGEGKPPAGDSLEGGSPVADLRARVDALRAQLDECALDVTVRAVSDDEWQRLVDENPPRRGADGQGGDPRDAESGWNSTTFPKALLRAATVAPDLDDDDWQDLLGVDGQPGILTHPQIQEAAGEIAGLSRFKLDIPFS